MVLIPCSDCSFFLFFPISFLYHVLRVETRDPTAVLEAHLSLAQDEKVMLDLLLLKRLRKTALLLICVNSLYFLLYRHR